MSTNLIVVALDESQLELVFRRVDLQNASFRFSIHTIDGAAVGLGHVDGHIKGANNAIVSYT